LFCMVGAIPAALGGEAFGFWRLPTTTYQLAAPPWARGALSYDAPLAAPSAAYANATLHIVTAPGAATLVATLEPGFALRVTRYATDAGARWAQVTWGGPTPAAGGSGWTLAKGLLAGSPGAQARDIGDLGALSPAFGQAVSALGPGFASALYFPGAQASYHTASIDQAQPLGAQVIPLVLMALYANGVAASQPTPTNGAPQIARDLALGNPQALAFDYRLVGDAQGMDSLLTQRHITGFQFATQAPTQTTGTVRGLSLFYTALSGGALVSPTDSATIIALLASADATAATAVAPQSVLGSGALDVTTSGPTGGVVMIAAGVLSPAGGPSVVVVAVAHGATAAAAQTSMQTYFGRLIAVMRG